LLPDREQITLPPDGRSLAEQPKWRQDFPIDWPQDHYVARRDFTKFMVLTSFAFVVGQAWIVMLSWIKGRRGKFPTVEIATVDTLPVGGAKLFHYPTEIDPCLLVRLSQDEFVAFGQKCTHLSCPVIPRPREGRFYCPCHAGSFDLKTGFPTAGPPRRPLPRILIERRGGKIFATGLAGEEAT